MNIFLQKFSVSKFFVIFMAISILMPFSLTGTGYHDSQRVIQIVGIILCSILLYFRLNKLLIIFYILDRNIRLFLFLFLFFGFFSSVISYSPFHAFYEFSSFLLLILLSLLIAEEVASGTEIFFDKVFLFIGCGCAIYVLRALATYISIINYGNQPDSSEFIVGFDNYRFFNHVQTITLPLLCLLVFRNNGLKKFRFNLWWILLSLWWMLLFVSGGRGTFVGILTGLLIAGFCLRKNSLPWLKVMLLSGLIGLIAYIFFYLWIPVVFDLQAFGFLTDSTKRSFSNFSNGRWSLWKRAIQIIIENPFLGVGPLHFAHYGQDMRNGAHPHNWILQIASEWGVPALISLSFAIFISLRNLVNLRFFIRVNDIQNHAILTTWLVTGVAILVDGLVSGLFVMPVSQLWVSFYLGFSLGWILKIAKSYVKEETIFSKKIFFVFTSLIFFSVICLISELSTEFFYLSENEKTQQELYPAIYPSTRFSPRIWGAGYF